MPEMAWSFLERTGIADDECVPYNSYDPRKAPWCSLQCHGGPDRDKRKRPTHVHRASSVRHYKGVAAMMAAVEEGPVAVYFNVYGDFQEHWRTGGDATYTHTRGGFEGIHAVKLVGYGVDSDSTPYWTCENSWGLTGGFGFGVPAGGASKGYFRIRRGTNECGIESLAYGGWPAERVTE